MTDLVNRLRLHDDPRLYREADVLMMEAADEIERLTKERDEQKERNAIMKSNIAILEAELREQLAACQKDAELKQQLTDCQRDYEDSDFKMQHYQEALAAAKMELDDMKEDAARYRWLRSENGAARFCQFSDGVNVGIKFYFEVERERPEALDAAIDAAMEQRT